jgi:hypothetical protein
MGQTDGVAKVVLSLASAAADYMTDSLVLVDGELLLSYVVLPQWRTHRSSSAR